MCMERMFCSWFAAVDLQVQAEPPALHAIMSKFMPPCLPQARPTDGRLEVPFIARDAIWIMLNGRLASRHGNAAEDVQYRIMPALNLSNHHLGLPHVQQEDKLRIGCCPEQH